MVLYSAGALSELGELHVRGEIRLLGLEDVRMRHTDHAVEFREIDRFLLDQRFSDPVQQVPIGPVPFFQISLLRAVRNRHTHVSLYAFEIPRNTIRTVSFSKANY